MIGVNLLKLEQLNGFFLLLQLPKSGSFVLKRSYVLKIKNIIVVDN